jgi:hypothetical protein
MIFAPSFLSAFAALPVLLRARQMPSCFQGYRVGNRFHCLARQDGLTHFFFLPNSGPISSSADRSQKPAAEARQLLRGVY